MAWGSGKALEEEMKLELGYKGWAGLWSGRKEQAKPEGLGQKAWGHGEVSVPGTCDPCPLIIDYLD